MKEKTKIIIASVVCTVTIILVCLGSYFYVNRDKYFNNQSETTTSGETTTQPTTENDPYLKGVDFAEYDISMSKTGNLIGNLNKNKYGSVAYKGRTEFHSVPNVGIFAFNVDTEESTLIVGGEGEFNYQYINCVGSKLFFINSVTNILYTCDVKGQNFAEMKQGVYSVFAYDSNLFYVADGVYTMKINGSDERQLMKKTDDEEFSIVGVTNNRLFFSAKSLNSMGVKWYSVNFNKPKDIKEFYDETAIDELNYPQYTEGWFYFSKSNGNSFDLYRQKVGDDNSLELLVENVAEFTVKINCVYYSVVENGVCNTYELNVNSDETKIVAITPANSEISADFQTYIGTEYVYVLGKVGDNLSFGKTCIYTAANVMMFYNFNTRTWAFA